MRFRSFEGNGENNDNDPDTSTNEAQENLPPIDPNDPEALVKYKQEREQDPFSKIISINNGILHFYYNLVSECILDSCFRREGDWPPRR